MSEQPRQSTPRTFAGRRQLLVVAILIASVALLWDGEPAWQQMIPVSAAEPEAAADKPDETTPAATPVRLTEKQRKAYMGLAALVGIVIAGLAVVALIILWGGRLRRQFRRPLPDADAPVRDFWFLKPPKPPVTRSSLPEVQQSNDTPSDSP